MSDYETCDPRATPVALVLQHLASLDHHVTRSLDVDLAAAVDGDVLAADEDRAILLHRDACRARLKRDLITGIDEQLLADLQRIVFGNIDLTILSNRDVFVFRDLVGAIVADADGLVLGDGQ